MDAEGYPEDRELKKIEKWDWKDIFSLIDFIEERWAYKDWGFKKKWGRDRMGLHKQPVMLLELHTAGWSGNEDIINSLLKNRMAGIVMGYYMWKAGGHYYFQINPASLGYITVAQFAKEKKVSRQYIHHRKEKWDWLNAGEKLKMVRPLPTASDALTKQEGLASNMNTRKSSPKG